MLNKLALILCIITFQTGLGLGATWFVDASAAGGGNGSSGAPFDSLDDVFSGAPPWSDGDTIVVATGTYSLSGTSRSISNTNNLRILSTDPDNPSDTVIDGGGTQQFLSVSSSQNIAFIGFTFNNCHSAGTGGVFSLTDSQINFRHCQFTQNNASSAGGAIYHSLTTAAPGPMRFESCTFANNSTVNGPGGAIYYSFSAGANIGTPGIEIDHSTFDSNVANSTGTVEGGAIYFFHNTFDEAKLDIFDSTFSQNQAITTGTETSTPARGGAIWYQHDCSTGIGNFNISCSTFDNNSVIGQGGAIYARSDHASPDTTILRIGGSRFTNNTASQDGGALNLYTGSSVGTDDFDVFIFGTRFLNNTGGTLGTAGYGYGGAAYMQHGQMALQNCEFASNSALDGGGVYLYDPDSEPNIDHCTFYNNSATGTGTDGGAIYINEMNASAPYVCSNTVFNSNASNGGGNHPEFHSTIAGQMHDAAFTSALHPDADTNSIILADPMFVDSSTSAPDLRLQSGSGLINAVSISSGATYDFYGYQRTFVGGTAADIGAHEYINHPITLFVSGGTTTSDYQMVGFPYMGTTPQSIIESVTGTLNPLQQRIYQWESTAYAEGTAISSYGTSSSNLMTFPMFMISRFDLEFDLSTVLINNRCEYEVTVPAGEWAMVSHPFALSVPIQVCEEYNNTDGHSNFGTNLFSGSFFVFNGTDYDELTASANDSLAPHRSYWVQNTSSEDAVLRFGAPVGFELEVPATAGGGMAVAVKPE